MVIVSGGEEGGAFHTAGGAGGRGLRGGDGGGPGAGGPPGDITSDEAQESVARLLQAHGFPESTARLLVPVGQALRQEARRLGVEQAASFDLDTAQPTGPLRTGRAAEVNITAQLRTMRPDRRYVSLHTHRASTAFSDLDFEVLLANAPLQAVAAIGWDGTWHILSKRPNVTPADPERAVSAYQTAMAHLAPDYLALVREGAATRQEALRRLLDTLCRLVAPLLGLRYDQN